MGSAILRRPYFILSRRTTPALLLGLTLSFGVFSPAASAQTSNADEARALELFDQGAAHFRAGEFHEAIRLLEEANRLKPSAVIHYNLARAYEGLGDTRKAAAEYGTYLRLAPEAADRRAVERRVAVLEKELAQQARAERQRRARAAPAQAEKPAIPTAPAPERSASPVPWIVASVGVGVIAAGAFFGLRAKSEEQAANDDPIQESAADTKADAERFATFANVAFIAGGTLVVGGTVWGVLDVSAASSRDGGRAWLGVAGRF